MTVECKPDHNMMLSMTADIVTSYVSTNRIDASEVPGVISSVFDAPSESVAKSRKPEPLKPAVPIRESVTKDYIICLEDGKQLKMMKRYLRTRYNMSPEEYRARWNLPADYPMVAPAYSERRSALAKEIGLGRKPENKEKPATKSRAMPRKTAGAATKATKPTRRPRSRKVEAA